MGTRFFTNEGENTLLNKFMGVFRNNPDIDFFDALVGYFRTSGYFAIRPYLDKVPHIRILVGIDTDRILARYNEAGMLFRGDDEATREESLRNFRKDIATCAYSSEIEDGICRFVEDVATGKVEIRAHKTRRLHAKIYIFRPANWNEHRQGSVITGSSNLTDAGLGVGKASNYEFNVQLHEYDDVSFATSEFSKLWDEAVRILPEQLMSLKTRTHLNDRVTPFELYVKMLASYFGKDIDYNPDAVDLPNHYKKLSYQIDAVNQGYDKLCKYNGFFLADVVGLGKTVVALLIARKFFFGNGYPEHRSRILVICPPAVYPSWEKTVDDFALNCRIITNGSIHKEEKRFQSYDLIIIDEAHRFRNANSIGYNELQRLCKSPAPPGGILGKNPGKKKVILVSATPLNNGPADIRSQTYLFQDGGDTDLDIPNLEDFFTSLTRRYNEAKKLGDSEAKPVIREINEELRNQVIFPLTIRRTRADLMNNEAYREDLKKQGIVFPESPPPVPLFYRMNDDLDHMFDQTLECLSKKLNYSRYAAIGYLKPESKRKFKNSADNASGQLPAIMRSILVKRLDSSFHAFKISLQHFLDGVRAMLKMLDDDHVFILPDVNVTELVMNDDLERLQSIFTEKSKDDPSAEIFRAGDFEPSFRTELEKDERILSELNDYWKLLDDDPKYDEFLKDLRTVFLDRRSNPSGKLVVFSEAEDTTRYLHDRLRKDGFDRVLAVHAGNRDAMQKKIGENFDANLEKVRQRDDYDMIICTEVLAEGVNLHRAGLIVNYDTPWNSTRLMQRVGRINRIGSMNKSIGIYNFLPTKQVNDVIELQKNASLKLLAFHHALGSDSQIYSPDEEKPGSFGLFSPNYDAWEQDKRLSILLKLRRFREEDPERFKSIVDLPLKIRSGRMETEATSQEFPAEATIAYLKNERRDLFFAVSGDDKPKLISFLDAERLLRCGEEEPRRDIPKIHYRHVNDFLRDFEQKHREEASKRQATTRLSPQARQALKYLAAMLTKDILNDQERALIEQAKDTIGKSKYSRLPREINGLAKSRLSPVDNLESLMRIIRRYIGDDSGDSSASPESFGGGGEKPDIIISETLVRQEGQRPRGESDNGN